MKRLLSPVLPKPGKPVKLPESEATHAVRVLRLREGDRIEALDGSGKAVIAVLRLFSGDPHLEFESVVEKPATTVFPVTLELAVLKGDAMEWSVEKAVELGVTRLVPVLTARTVVQMDRKGPEAFRDRWQKIADQALKQCGRLESLEIAMPVAVDELLAKEGASAESPRAWFDEDSRESAPEALAFLRESAGSVSALRILIGPEGGWSEEERVLLSREAHTSRLSLGPLVLRAETAAISAVSVVTAWARADRLKGKSS